ncbi:CDP-alcohol phosphatidyltransferase family protein [Ignatzschineria sp. LJL83]
MISIYSLKSKFQNLLRPFVKNLYQWGVTANQVTLFACLASIFISIIAIIILPSVWILTLIPVWMFIRMALNAIDGMLAREFSQKSILGAYLNELCDVIADSFLFAIFIFIPGIELWAILPVIFLAIVSEYAGVMAPLIGAERRYDGPMGKSDRAFVFGTLSLLIGLKLLPAFLVNFGLWIISALLIYTIVNRVRKGISAGNL